MSDWVKQVTDLASQLYAVENTAETGGDELLVPAIFLHSYMGRKVLDVNGAIGKLFDSAPLSYRNRRSLNRFDCEFWKEISGSYEVLVLHDENASPNENLLIQRWLIPPNKVYFYYAKFCSDPTFRALRKGNFPYDPNNDKFIAFIFDPNCGDPACPGVEESFHLACIAIGWIRRFALHVDRAR